MAKVLVDESCFSGIAAAIREKTSSTATYKPREMADAISKIQGGAKTKFGVSVDNVIGDVSADGVLSAPEPADVVLEGVTTISSGALAYCSFAKSFSAPDLEEVTVDNALALAFNHATGLAKIGFPKLRTVNGKGVFHHALEGASGLVSVDFSSLERVYGAQAFYMVFHGCTALTGISFPSLLTVNGSSAFAELFYSCTRLTSVQFPSLEIITGDSVFRYVFDGCSKLQSVEFPALVTIDCYTTSNISGEQFYAATAGSGITTMRFPKLKRIYANGSGTSGPFRNCNTLTRIDFPALTTIGTHYTGTSTVSDSAVSNMFYQCAKLTEIHFGAANQAAVEAMPGYDTLWGRGAGNATVYFDL